MNLATSARGFLRGRVRGTRLGLFMALVLLGAGVAAACGSGGGDAAEERVTELEQQLEQQAAESEALRVDKTELERQLQGEMTERTSLTSLREDLNRRIAELESQVEALTEQSATAPEGLTELEDQLLADRLLLVEMRKEAPSDVEERLEAETFWVNVKDLAKRSDPSLAPKVDKVQRALPNYFRFLNQQFTSDLEFQLTYRLLAADYDNATSEFWNSFVLVLIDRIESLSRLAAGE